MAQKSKLIRPLRTKREQKPSSPRRKQLYEIIFEAETPGGTTFDVLLLISIAASVLVVMLESIQSLREPFGAVFYAIEWVFTILFSIEYILRLLSVRRPHRYALSFFGVVDLLSVLPTYLSLVISGAQMLLIIRVLRLLRIFRVFKLSRYLGEAKVLLEALAISRHKITVFLGAVLSLVLIMGSLMYLVEGPEAGFTSIPRSIYWAIVTLTTVGYGDITPTTPIGQAISSLVMITGYAIIAVPTGIMTVALSQTQSANSNARACPSCNASDHAPDAQFCRCCGGELGSAGG